MSVATLPGSRIPGIEPARTYERARLRADLLAAVTVWELMVPQALAYAQLAEVDLVVGLHAGTECVYLEVDDALAAFAASALARTPPGAAG